MVAGDGETAWQRYQETAEQIDLIIADVMLPGRMNGWDVLTHIWETGADPPAVLVSGQPPESLPALLTEQSAVPLIRKPFRPAELLQVLGAGGRKHVRNPETGTGG